MDLDIHTLHHEQICIDQRHTCVHFNPRPSTFGALDHPLSPSWTVHFPQGRPFSRRPLFITRARGTDLIRLRPASVSVRLLEILPQDDRPREISLSIVSSKYLVILEVELEYLGHRN